MPDAQRPCARKLHRLSADTQVVPHHHAWGQVALSTTGVVRLTVEHGTYIVPPSRALWIPPGVEHAVTVVEDAELRTLYLHQPRGRSARRRAQRRGRMAPMPRARGVGRCCARWCSRWTCAPDGAEPPPDADGLQRERRLSARWCSTSCAAPARCALGVDLPADKRLRALCEAVLDDPTRHATLDGWARDSGASARTVARLFRSELGTIVRAVAPAGAAGARAGLAARKMPMATIAAELGYASPSAFSAMVRRSVGAPPRAFFGS